MGAVDELGADFEKAVSKIDFGGYDPTSGEFEAALNIGMMRFFIMSMPAQEKPVAVTEQADGIGEAVSLGKRLLQKSIDTGDYAYRELAARELETAGSLVRKSLARLPSGEERSRLKGYEAEIQEIKGRLA